jgi:outer membrane protein OmpA-like peptidoglycan-associated protein
MKNKIGFTAIALASCVLLTAAPVTAQGPYLFGGGIYEIPDSARDSDNGIGFNLGVGLPLSVSRPGESIEFVFRSVERDRDIDDRPDYQHSMFVDWRKSLSEDAALQPYLLVGAGAIQEDVAGDKHLHFGLDGGMGALWVLGTSGWGLRAEALAQAQLNDESVPDEDALLDFHLRLGVHVPLGFLSGPAAPPVEPAPECPVRVVDPVTGASNCSVDSDKDGVDDGTDLCPGTPTGTAVDTNGCAVGGTVDSDGDGVIDEVDACPESPVGMVVDGTGCLIEQTVTLRGVRFEPGSARLTADARLALDEVARTLKNQRSLAVEISGHTDSQGNDDFNLLLSQQRAESVRQHLIGRGVAPERLTAVGMGETLPVAPNDSEEGRERNRRVEFKVVVQ